MSGLTGIPSIEYILVAASLLLLASVFASKLTDKWGVPSLLIFLAIGMLGGSEGIGRIQFDNAALAKSIGVIALSFILFSGGLDTDYSTIRKVASRAILLSTAGVLITAFVVGIFAVRVLHMGLLEGMLLGAIVSSTDAAAVFSILRSKNISLKGSLRPLLELESGSNDPMAVFLTVGLIHLIRQPDLTWIHLLGMFIWQFIFGLTAGFLVAALFRLVIRRINLEYDALYTVLTFSLVLFAYGGTQALGGNGFLSVYAAGLFLSKKDFFYRRNLMRFHDALAWLMQILMFLALGLLVYPSKLLPVWPSALVIVVVLIFVARPAGVFLCLPLAPWREKLMISWVGLRGAAPIVLATFPLLAGVSNSEVIFNVVFFAVLASVLIQGSTIPWVANALKVNAPVERKFRYPIEFEQREGVDADLLEFIVPYDGVAAGKSIYELDMPQDSLAVLIGRDDKFIVAKGNSVLDEGDVVLVLASQADLPAVRNIFTALRKNA